MRVLSREEYRIALATFLSEERAKRDWSTRKASEALGIDWRAYCRLERGEVNAHDSTLNKVRRHYGYLPPRVLD